jgi:hypothetical protein
MDTTKSGKFMVDKNGYSYWSANGDTQASDSGAQTGDQFRGEIYTGVLDRQDFVPRKPVAAMAFGGRVRIARLYKDYEDLIGKVIRVGGWAKSTRA